LLRQHRQLEGIADAVGDADDILIDVIMHVDPNALLMLEFQDVLAQLERAAAAFVVILLRVDTLQEAPVALIGQPVGVAVVDELFDSLQLVHHIPPEFVCVLHEVWPKKSPARLK
jgi:hypothetical protein